MYQPEKAPGLLVGGTASLLILALMAVAAALLLTQPFSVLSVLWVLMLTLGLPMLIWLGYRTAALAGARYTLTEGALVIDWGARHETIPLPHIQAVQSGLALSAPLRPAGLHWPGCFAGLADHPELGRVEMLAHTLDPNTLVLVAYPEGWLALSTPQAAAFIEALNTRRAEPAPLTEPESIWPVWMIWEVGRDRMAQALLGAGLLGWLGLLVYLAVIFPQLPPQIALRFGADGLPDRFGPPDGLLILPLIGALSSLFNGALGAFFHFDPERRPAAYLLWGAAVFVQVLVWLAAVGLLTAGAG